MTKKEETWYKCTLHGIRREESEYLTLLVDGGFNPLPEDHLGDSDTAQKTVRFREENIIWIANEEESLAEAVCVEIFQTGCAVEDRRQAIIRGPWERIRKYQKHIGFYHD